MESVRGRERERGEREKSSSKGGSGRKRTLHHAEENTTIGVLLCVRTLAGLRTARHCFEFCKHFTHVVC